MDLNAYQKDSTGFSHLSLRDLLDARDQYHVFLMEHPNVVATAVGRSRIPAKDSWPSQHGPGKVHGTYPRTLENSEVRDYSWPAILVFVETWVPREDLVKRGDALVPSTLYLPDGRRVPVCVIEAPKEHLTDIEARDVRYPLNNIGGGSAIIADVQGRQYAATIACLVSDGHKVYALTNRHVAGEKGEVVYSRLDGRAERVGVTAGPYLTREPFTEMYPGWPGKDVYVNVDVGLIEVDDVDRWTTNIRDIGQAGQMVDLSVNNLSLALIGCDVRGTGAASGVMLGEIHALFYRYKTGGGFEYVSDLLIGPRSTGVPAKAKVAPFATHPGDSGTLWLLDPVPKKRHPMLEKAADEKPPEYLPLAMQWGRNMLRSAGAARPQSYALATLLSRVCAQLGVDPSAGVEHRSAGHLGIDRAFLDRDADSGCALDALSQAGQVDEQQRAHRQSRRADHRGQRLRRHGLGGFRPDGRRPGLLLEAPDRHQGFSRGSEGPNHFADMDQPDENGLDAPRDLSKDEANIDPDKWDSFYDSVTDLLSGEAIKPQHRGLLPFRVWQIFDEMVGFAKDGKGPEFVCAAGVLTHYIGDACQPLHISYLHDGDPERAFTYTFTKGKKAGQTEERPLGQGVHSAYEDEMVNAKRDLILKGLLQTPKVKKAELVANGFEAAKAVIAMMRATFTKIPPMDIVNAFVSHKGGGAARADFMWGKFGNRTITVMQGGSHLLGVLWESAWAQGKGEQHVTSTAALTEKAAMKIVQDADFLPSVTVDKIGALLTRP